MSKIDPSAYRAIVTVRKARIFDAAGFLMRFYGYMMNIGTVSMLSLAGYSFLTAGFVSSVIALVVFVVSPRIGKLVDEHGQHRVVPIAAAITLIGLVLMLLVVQVHGPEWMLFAAAVPMGFVPSAQALARARWTYLVRTGLLGKDAPSIHTVFSYEGLIDDVAFMLGPPTSIAIAAAICPIAGLATGGILFVIGVAIMTCARSTEPVPGWEALEGNEGVPVESATEDDEAAEDGALLSGGAAAESAMLVEGMVTPAKEGALDPATTEAKHRSVIRTVPQVRVLFVMMLLIGACYGIFDTTGVAFAEEKGDPNIASIALMGSAIISIIVGFVFGMLRLRLQMASQVMMFAILFGIAYGSLILIYDVPTFLIISFAGALFYAPCLITMNAACESMVPGKQLTEAITWLNAGSMCGLAIGPSVAGIVIDALGSLASFDVGGAVALAMTITALCCSRVLRRNA